MIGQLRDAEGACSLLALGGWDAMAGCAVDEWVQCEYCMKWRRLGDGRQIDETDEFRCLSIGISCDDAEEQWSEESNGEDAMDEDTLKMLPTQDAEFAQWKMMYAEDTRESPI